MPNYRLYPADRLHGNGVGLDVSFDDDDAARHFAQTFWRLASRVEIWCGERLVGEVDAPFGSLFGTRVTSGGFQL